MVSVCDIVIVFPLFSLLTSFHSTYFSQVNGLGFTVVFSVILFGMVQYDSRAKYNPWVEAQYLIEVCPCVHEMMTECSEFLLFPDV